MSALAACRRVVTGINAEGKSCIVLDGPLTPSSRSTASIWHTPTLPADNSGSADSAPDQYSFELMHSGGGLFTAIEYPPAGASDTLYWHATDTIDYLVILQGEVTLITETGEVTLKAGDFFIDRGINHAWRNDGSESCVAAAVILPAHPVGSGRNV